MMVLVLSGQLSFGTGNETCCPDSPRTEMSAAEAQVQLDVVQSDTHLATAVVPSLQPVVSRKFQAWEAMMTQVQVETETLNPATHVSFSEEVAFKLNSQFPERLPDNSQATKF